MKSLQAKAKKLHGDNAELVEQVQKMQDENDNLKTECAQVIKQQRNESMRVIERLEEECKAREKERDMIEAQVKGTLKQEQATQDDHHVYKLNIEKQLLQIKESHHAQINQLV